MAHFDFPLIFTLKSGLIFLETCYLYVFYSFYNTYAFFCNLKKIFGNLCCRWNYFLLFYFCFKNLDLLDWQITQFDFFIDTLFVIFISCGLNYQCNLYTLNNTLFQFFPQVLLVLFLIVRFSCLILWVVFFLTLHFKHFDFTEWFNLSTFLFYLLVLLTFCSIFLIVCL